MIEMERVSHVSAERNSLARDELGPFWVEEAYDMVHWSGWGAGCGVVALTWRGSRAGNVTFSYWYIQYIVE